MLPISYKSLTAVVVILLSILLVCTASQPQPIHAQSQPTGWLHTDGNQIKDSDGNVVRLTGVNWFGLESGNFVLHGLWAKNWEEMLDQIGAEGFNIIRIPFSDELLEPGQKPDSIDEVKNPDLFIEKDLPIDSIELLDKVIEGAGKRGMMIMLDHHRSSAGVSAPENGLWYDDNYSADDWVANWEFLAERYKDQPAVVAMDLQNEPHNEACWGCGDPALDWPMAAERAGNAILAINPNVLLMVEGVQSYNPETKGTQACAPGTSRFDCPTKNTWWGGNLMGVKDRPVVFDVPNRLVYSPHEYGEGVYPQPWFSEPDYPENLYTVWHDYWGYIHEENIAPLLFGEFGGKEVDTESVEGIWINQLVEFITEKGMHYTYWSWNPNSGDTGGLVEHDWETIEEEKMELLRPSQFPFECPICGGDGSDPSVIVPIACDAEMVLDGPAWEGGYQARMNITNTGENTIKDWNLTFDWGAADNSLANGWEATVSGTATGVSATAANDPTSLAVGQTVGFGIVINGSAELPTEFYVNGQLCGEDPAVAPTEIPATEEPAPTPIVDNILSGDVNCDGRESLVDAVLLQRYNAQLIPAEDTCDVPITNQAVYLPACDKNGDDKCTLVDVIIILQCNAAIDNGYCTAE